MLVCKCGLKSRAASLLRWQKTQQPKGLLASLRVFCDQNIVFAVGLCGRSALGPSCVVKARGAARRQLGWGGLSWAPWGAAGPEGVGHKRGDELGPRLVRQPGWALALLRCGLGWSHGLACAPVGPGGLHGPGEGSGCPQGPGGLGQVPFTAWGKVRPFLCVCVCSLHR